jgi:DNA-binding CsgD family transcriptional regulator
MAEHTGFDALTKASQLGLLCGAAEGRRDFLRAFQEWSGADSALLLVGEDIELLSWEGSIPSADQLPDGPAFGPCRDGWMPGWGLTWTGEAGALVACWQVEPPEGEGLARVLGSAVDAISSALGRLQATPVPPGGSAWRRCNVPLIYLDDEGAVLEANPAAVRKLELDESLELPEWLEERVDERIIALRRSGLEPGASGDYSYLRPAGNTFHRIGLAPLDQMGPGGASWLLSVERGGPGLDERIRLAEIAYGLTPREGEILSCLAEGLSNKAIATAIGIREPTVKFHLVSVMRKSGTSSRTDLLAGLYGLKTTEIPAGAL